MRRFVNIEKMYSEPADRNLEFLSAVYADEDKLKEVIIRLLNGAFNSGDLDGKRILIKPNWVKENFILQDEVCLRTHDQFLLSALEIIMSKKPCKVIIGDAPIQGCKWDEVVSIHFVREVEKLSAKFNVPVEIIDFRRVTFNPSLNNPINERSSINDYVIFDLEKDSFLESISIKGKELFRVTNYNPRRLAVIHTAGTHKYCITKELFNADVVISIPKVKTHQKTCITAALKNLVGLNGDKDFLPHHRLGGTGFGGDCYPGKNYLRYWAELALDYANRRQGKFSYWFGYKFSNLLWKLSFPGAEHNISAGWHGNDTTWRMVLDLNKIAIFGKIDGSIAKSPQRRIFSLCDGIVGGQGDGPLKPEPLPLGVICFTNESAATDICLATMMGFNPVDIPLLCAAGQLFNIEDVDIHINSIKSNYSELGKMAIDTMPPSGWVKYFNSRLK